MYLCVAQTDIVKFQHPVAGGGVLFFLGLVAGKMVHEALEVEHLSILLDIGIQSRQRDMFQIHRVSEQFQQLGFHIQGVEADEHIAAVVFIKIQTPDSDMACVDVHLQLVHMHLAPNQLLAVVVDIALGDGRHQQRCQHYKPQQRAHYPQCYLYSFFHS